MIVLNRMTTDYNDIEHAAHGLVPVFLLHRRRLVPFTRPTALSQSFYYTGVASCHSRGPRPCPSRSTTPASSRAIHGAHGLVPVVLLHRRRLVPFTRPTALSQSFYYTGVVSCHSRGPRPCPSRSTTPASSRAIHGAHGLVPVVLLHRRRLVPFTGPTALSQSLYYTGVVSCHSRGPRPCPSRSTTPTSSRAIHEAHGLVPVVLLHRRRLVPFTRPTALSQSF